MKYNIVVTALFFVTSQATDVVLRVSTQDQKNPFEYITISEDVAPVLYAVAKDEGKADLRGRTVVDVDKIVRFFPEGVQVQKGIEIIKQFSQIYPLLLHVEKTHIEKFKNDRLTPEEALDAEPSIFYLLNLNKEEYAEKLVHFITFADYVHNKNVLPILSELYFLKIAKEPISLLKSVQLPLSMDKKIAELLIQDVTRRESWHPFDFSKCQFHALDSTKPKIKAGIKAICDSYKKNPNKRFAFDAFYFCMMVSDVNNRLKTAEQQKQVMGVKLYEHVSNEIKSAINRVYNPPLHLRAYDWMKLMSHGVYTKLNSFTKEDVKWGMGAVLFTALYAGVYYYFYAPQYDKLGPVDQRLIRALETFLPRRRGGAYQNLW